MRRLRPDHPRNLFIAELKALKATRAEQAALGPGHPIEVEFKQALYCVARSLGHSVAKCNEATVGRGYEQAFRKLLGPPRGSESLFEDCMRPFRERIGAEYESLKARAELHETRLRELAALTDPRGGTSSLVYCSKWSSTHRSTCSGEHYAKVEAEILAEELGECFGLKSEIEAKTWTTPGSGVDEYKVLVLVQSATDIEIAKRSPKKLPLPEVVRRMWAKGANARVYYPMLPHGYEEQHGFDFFGQPLPQTGLRAP